MELKKRILLFGWLLCASSAFAAHVDTLMVPSASMNKSVEVVIVVPDAMYRPDAKPCPVVYLLHGFGGNARTWLDIKPNLPQLSDEKGMIFVCPDGKASWYWDSPKNPDVRYETFTSSELVEYVDSHYTTIARREGRAITGLSMGGHGALWNAIRHKDVFGACGSMSGGVDIRPFPNNWRMSKQLGDLATNKDVWDAHTVVNQVDKLQNGDLAIIFDCGVADIFQEVNKTLHNLLLERKIDHDFITRPGGHNNAYWANSIDYHLLFFSKYFHRNFR